MKCTSVIVTVLTAVSLAAALPAQVKERPIPNLCRRTGALP